MTDAVHEAALAVGDMPAVLKRGIQLAQRAFSEASPQRRKLALRKRAVLLLSEELAG